MGMRHKQEVAYSSFTSNSSDDLSQEILKTAQTCFTPELLKKAQNNGLITEPTSLFMEQLPQYLEKLLRN